MPMTANQEIGWHTDVSLIKFLNFHKNNLNRFMPLQKKIDFCFQKNPARRLLTPTTIIQ